MGAAAAAAPKPVEAAAEKGLATGAPNPAAGAAKGAPNPEAGDAEVAPNPTDEAPNPAA